MSGKNLIVKLTHVDGIFKYTEQCAGWSVFEKNTADVLSLAADRRCILLLVAAILENEAGTRTQALHRKGVYSRFGAKVAEHLTTRCSHPR